LRAMNIAVVQSHTVFFRRFVVFIGYYLLYLMREYYIIFSDDIK